MSKAISEISELKKIISKNRPRDLTFFYYLVYFIVPIILVNLFDWKIFPLILLVAGVVFSHQAMLLLMKLLKPVDYKYVKLVNDAIPLLENKPLLAIEKLLQAYEIKPQEDLHQVIKKLAERFNLVDELKIFEIKMFYGEKMPEVFKSIFEKLEKIKVFKKQASDNLDFLKEELAKNEKKFEQTPEKFKKEVDLIVKKYKNLINLEQNKLEFYKSLEKQLINIAQDIFYREKIEREKQKLEQISEQMLKESIEAQYKTEDFRSFVEEKKIYLKLIDEYSEKINLLEDEDEFEKLKNDFQHFSSEE